MENKNVMPEILENDLIKTSSKIWSVGKADRKFIDEIYTDNLNEDEEQREGYVNKLYYDYYGCDDDCYYSYISFVNHILESITAIYRKVGKDYICIWEKA